MIEYLILILTIPLGLALANVTKDEKNIYSKKPYFPILLIILAIATAIFFVLDKQTATILLFILITTLVWNKA